MTEKRNLKFNSDPGHGWLSVTLKDLETLNIMDEISSYSYMTTTRAYLEEDQDAGIFLKAAKNAGWEVSYKDTYNEKTPIRNYPYYNTQKAQLALNLCVGSPIYLYNKSQGQWNIEAEVSGFEDNKIQIKDQFGNRYETSKAKFFSGVEPRALTLEQEVKQKIKNSL